MSAPEIAVQRAMRARLVASVPLSALVPPAAILDVNQRPAPRPSIIIGESTVRDEGADIDGKRRIVTHTLHVWTMERGTVEAKTVMGEIEDALGAANLDPDGWAVVRQRMTFRRVLRDPDGETAHGVLTFETEVHRE